MSSAKQFTVAGVDVGTECVKALVLDAAGTILGRNVVPATGYYLPRVAEALEGALDEASIKGSELTHVAVTGFGAKAKNLESNLVVAESTAHARGAHHYHPKAITVLDLGARSPSVIHVDKNGQRKGARGTRKCAAGFNVFLTFAARHLDVHPSRLAELAATAKNPIQISSYCSVFGETELLEHVRAGVPRERIALGCLHAIAERALEIGPLTGEVVVTGGLAEHYPGILNALTELGGGTVTAIPQPIMAGALGAALQARDAVAAAE